MEYSEQKLATFTEGKTRIQLLKLTNNDQLIENRFFYIKYQIRINRKRIYTTEFENDARKCFATLINNNVLQLKINEYEN